MVDVILTRRAEFTVFTGYISDYDQRMALLEESCTQHPAFSGIVTEYQVRSSSGIAFFEKGSPFPSN